MLAFLADAYSVAYGLVNSMLIRLAYPAGACLLYLLPELLHILLNKVVTRDGPTVVTLENFGMAEVPYQIRNAEEIPAALKTLGYGIIDSWTIDSLAHRIQTHPHLGRAVYRGYAARLLQPA